MFNRYAGTILAPEELPNKSPSAKRIPVTQSIFYDSPFVPKTAKTKQLCTCCSKDLEQLSTRILEDGLVYCKECHLKLFNKGECPTCKSPVADTDNFIEYAKKIWHTSCFVCFNCKEKLEANPLVDLQDRPCCETCFMSQAGQRNTSFASPKLRGKVPESTSLDSSFMRLSVSSATSSTPPSFQRPRLEHDLFQPKTPPLTRTPSPKEDIENEISADLLSRRHRTSCSRLSPAASSAINHSSSEATLAEKRPSSLSQRPCHSCQLPLGNSSQKKVKIPL
ncbi:hypothetical protein BD560DRAFT_331397, partial [Blakeslea trispora]